MLPRAARKATILVVEDDPSLRELYRQALTIAGYAVVTVEDGIDALRRIDADDPTPHAVVLDLQLPRLSGRDVQQELAAHAQTRHIPIVVVSGAVTRDIDPSDFACVLRKPIDPEQLVKAVESCLFGASPLGRARRLLSRLTRRRASDQTSSDS